MIREITASASSIEEAIKKGAEELGVAVEEVKSEVITEPKKGFLGFGAVDAKVRVFYEITPAIKAKEFIGKVVSNMGIDCKIVEVEKSDDGVEFVLEGESEELGILIGHHGDVLESLQYLSSLAANRGTDDFYQNIFEEICELYFPIDLHSKLYVGRYYLLLHIKSSFRNHNVILGYV